MLKYDVCGLGIIVLDYLMTVDRYPEPNSKNQVRALAQQGGGPVPTALAAVSKWGKRTACICKLDDDPAADFLLHELQHFGIETSHCVRTPNSSTAQSFIVIDASSGDRTVFLNRSSDMDLQAFEVNPKVIRNSRLLHLDGRETEAAIFAATIARQSGVTVSIDIGSDRAIPEALLGLIDIAVVSESYADARLAPKNPLKSMEILLHYGVRLAGITCGTRGSYLTDGKTVVHQPAFTVQAVDTTGAGDVYHGGVLYAAVAGMTIEQTARFVSAAAALACTHIGGKTGIPTLEEISSFLSEHKA